MGKKDSSKTRVEPVFRQLYLRDPSGASWIDAIVRCGSRQAIVAAVPGGQRLVERHGERWGAWEVPLPAPRSLLQYLVQNLDEQLIPADDQSSAATKRRWLARRDADTIIEAIQLLNASQAEKAWFILEGASRPDALLETRNAVFCIQGKRTERECTTSTHWMRGRSRCCGIWMPPPKPFLRSAFTAS